MEARESGQRAGDGDADVPAHERRAADAHAHVAANARLTVSAAEAALAPGEQFGVVVDATQPIVVERAMYWNGGGQFWGAGTNETAVRLR